MTQPLTPASLRAAAEAAREKHRTGRVRGLLVGGSGLALAVPGWQATDEIGLGELVPLEMHELMGHAHTVTIWRRGDESLLVMNGRLHMYQGYQAWEVAAPVRLAALLGAEVMIATNATGALDPDIPPGSLVLLTDHLNLQGRNPLEGEWGRELGPQFPDLTEAYDPELRALAREAAQESGFEVFEGVYAAVLGPSFETPAEVRMLRAMGATVVGMSTVPEVIAARHMGLRVAAMSLAANPAAGLVDRPLTHTEVLEEGDKAAAKLADLIGRLVGKIFA